MSNYQNTGDESPNETKLSDAPTTETWPEGAERVRSNALLGDGGLEPSNNAFGATLGAKNDVGDQLGIVGDYEGVMSFLINAAQKKGIRLTEDDFRDSEVESLNHYVGIFRGKWCKLLDSIFECGESGSTAQEASESGGLNLGLSGDLMQKSVQNFVLGSDAGTIGTIKHSEDNV